MQLLKAHVHNGRLVLDEPTDLPDGEVVELVPLDDAVSRTTAHHRRVRSLTLVDEAWARRRVRPGENPHSPPRIEWDARTDALDPPTPLPANPPLANIA
jgi:hypothetical protein